MNDKEDVVVGWPEALEENEVIRLEDLPSKMGGAPMWLVDQPKEKLPSLTCDACGKNLKFLLQIYSPLEAFPQAFHRYLYVFVCENLEGCTNRPQGIYLYRCQLPEENPVLKYDADNDAYTATKQPEEVGAEHRLVEKQWIIETDMQSVQKQTEVKEEAEPEEPDEDDEDDQLGFDNREMKDDSFKLFKKFDEETPGHILRYSFSKDSRPLYYSDYDQFKHPVTSTCPHCSGPRIFEFQLNSQLLAEIDPLKSLDWGIVAFYTCASSCQPKDVTYVKEHVELQLAPEEVDRLNHRRMQERRMKQYENDMEADADDPDLTEEEIKAIEAQIKEEDKEDQRAIAREKLDKRIQEQNAKKAGEMGDKPDKANKESKKLFDNTEGDDDWT